MTGPSAVISRSSVRAELVETQSTTGKAHTKACGGWKEIRMLCGSSILCLLSTRIDARRLLGYTKWTQASLEPEASHLFEPSKRLPSATNSDSLSLRLSLLLLCSLVPRTTRLSDDTESTREYLEDEGSYSRLRSIISKCFHLIENDLIVHLVRLIGQR